jgi:hypothetical protein
MRRIRFNPEDIALPEGWAPAAAHVTQRLLHEHDPIVRAGIIDENSALWSAVRPAFRKLSHGKCWYTESRQEGTDVDIDHYRPKKRVAERAGDQVPHPGYWWLAFDLSNFRYSCIVANRRRRDVETDNVGGKGDHFPIWDEASRATTPDSIYQDEQPLLIDPCKAADVALITFKDDGEAMPRWNKDHPYKYTKADRSIELYSLNHTDFVKARIILRDKMRRLCEDAKRYFSKLESGDAVHAEAYENAISELIDLRSEKSPYSGFCVAFLDRFKDEEYLAGIFL